MRKIVNCLAPLALGLACLLWAAPPAEAHGHGFHGNYGHGGYGYNSFFVTRYNFYPAQYYVPVYPPTPVLVAQPPPVVVVPPPVLPNAVLPNAVPAEVPDPCGAAANTYGVAPLAQAAGYFPYFGTLAGYGGVPLYLRSFNFHVFDVRAGRFVRVRPFSINGVSRVHGFGGSHFAAAGFRGPGVNVNVAARGRGLVGNIGHAARGGRVTQKTTTKTTTQTKVRGRR